MPHELAPICLFAYKRLAELKRTIDSLENNIDSKLSDVYVFLDAASSSDDEKLVEEVRDYINQKKYNNVFQSFNIVIRDVNYGLSKNIVSGVTDIISQHGRVIVLEDDLITSSNFICFMNAALNHYQSRADIYSVSGFSFVLRYFSDYSYDTYLSVRPSSWGWATWRDQWVDIDWDVLDYEDFISDKSKTREFNQGGVDMTRMLRHYMENKNNSWAIRWSYSMYKQNKFSIYPTKSKVQNIGFGDGATHCSGNNIYKTVLDESSECTFSFVDQLYPNDSILKQFRYRYSYTNKVIRKLKYYMLQLINF